ncbi:MAG: hypothetical protein HeimC3_05060 [Candidatus Heimdallarchaeota archaeon LC_3]|nr:MAG: hypothetical protein HeimC3_05060 [Candidatus Heimdallarchaeota archaeon LC_3]
MPKIYTKKIITVGNSMGVYLPIELRELGYEPGVEVNIGTSGSNIVITPKYVFKSRVRGIKDVNGELRPIFVHKDDKQQSLRYEDLRTIEQGNNLISFVKDQVDDKIFMYYVVLNKKKDVIQSVRGNYISKLAMQDIIVGKNPEYYIV